MSGRTVLPALAAAPVRRVAVAAAPAAASAAAEVTSRAAADDADVLRPLLALFVVPHLVVGDLLALFEPLRLDELQPVDEDVLAAVAGRDEAEALLLHPFLDGAGAAHGHKGQKLGGSGRPALAAPSCSFCQNR